MTPARGRPDAVDVTLGQTRSLVACWLLRERLSVRTGVALAVGFGGLLVVAVPAVAVAAATTLAWFVEPGAARCPR